MKTNHKLFLYCNFLLPKKEWLLAMAFMLITTINVSAQNSRIIKGTITSVKDGMPLPGVNVLIKGSKTGITTDIDGSYSIKVSPNDVLVFSYIGFKNQEVKIGSQVTIDIKLKEEFDTLDVVVVTALGIKKSSKKLGYAVQTVAVDEMQKSRTTNLMSSLEGKVAGLDISPPSSGAGASTKIRLRGQSAFAGANNSPLIVINGLPIDQGASSANGNDSRDLGDNMQNFNPDDVESMTVLKGATAAAIYGSRAANGAIIITTKSGKKNQGMGIEYNSNFISNAVLDFSNFQQEYGQGQGGKKPTTQGNAISTGQFGWGAKLDGVPTVNFDGIQRPYSANPNRIKDFYRTGSTATNTIAISGGSDNGSFRASFANTQAEGIAPDNQYNKKIFNLGLNQDVTRKLKFNLNINYTHENNINPPQVGVQGPGSANFLYRMSTSIPLSAFRESVLADNGTERQTSGFQSTLINPYFQIGRQFYRNDKDRFLGTTTLRYDLTDWLYAQGRVNFDYSVGFTEFNSPTGMGTSSPSNGAGTGFNGSYNVNTNKGLDLNADFLLGANKNYGDFSVDVSIGGNILKSKGNGFTQGVTDFIVRDLYSIENGINKTQSYGMGRSQVNSLYGFAEFGYKGLLYLNVTARNDWFSVLNPKNNNYLYPSVSGSFIFSQLLKGNDWLNYGKLRGSYADVGSVNGIGIFSGNLNYGIAQNQFNGQTLASVANGDSPNPLLKPFSVVEKEIGLEMKMFKSRVNIDVSAYEKVTTNQILPVLISSASGYNATPQNLGSLQNRGLEFLLEVVPVKTNNFTWSSSFNNSYGTSKVLKLSPGVDRLVVTSFGGNEFLGSLVYEVGQPINQLSARTYLRDANGKILLNSNGRLIQSAKDVNFGSALPKFTGGWSNILNYKHVSLLMHIDYKFGGKMLSSTALNNLRQGHSMASLVGREGGVIFDGVYQSTGLPNTTAVDPQTFYTDYRNQQIADPFVFKSDFVKLRNITITYDFGSYLKNTFIRGLTLSASCRNVLILYKDIADLDPEAFSSSGDFRVGYEQTTLPTTRDFSINLNVKF